MEETPLRTPIAPTTVTTSLFSDISQLFFDYPNVVKFRRILEDLRSQRGVAFIEEFFNRLQLQYAVEPSDLEKIPAEGAFFLIANHPFGILDSMIILSIMKKRRPDFKLLDDGFLRKIEPLHNDIILMHPLENDLPLHFSFSSSRKIFDWLESGKPLGGFPSDDISRIQIINGRIEDGRWNKRYIRIIRSAEVPVLPLYIEGANSITYHLIGFVFSKLKNARLPSEIFRKKDDCIKVRIGMPIPVKQLKQFTTTNELSRFLRAKTYALSTELNVKKFFPQLWKKGKKTEPLVRPIPSNLVEADMHHLLECGAKLLSQMQLEVYLADIYQIPNAIYEIGRLRELTFREVGEGTGRKIDLDEFDLHYKQLILWDVQNKRIAGGYRMGLGDQIMHSRGVKGFYTQTLFKIDKPLYPLLTQSVELGRSFVVKEYQQKRLPLFLLWRGILAFLLKNPHYRYLFGPVSISSNYSETCRLIMVNYIRKNHFADDLAPFIKPRKKYQPKIKHIDVDILVDAAEQDIKWINNYIQDIDPIMTGIPVLLKKYLSQNARIAGFNVDPKFSEVLDGLMFLDLNDLPVSTIEGLR